MSANDTQDGVYIYNNTIANPMQCWSASQRTTADPARCLFIQGDMENFYCQNNVFYEIGASGGYLLGFLEPLISGSVDYNVYWKVNGGNYIYYDGYDIDYSAFASYQSGSGEDAYSVAANPSFRANTLIPQPASPAVNTGIALPDVLVDYTGLPRPQGGIYDKGGYEVPFIDALQLSGD